jgi:hypothetical protein
VACRKTPHIVGMKRKTANIDIRVEPQLIEKIDAWRARQRVAPSRAAAIGYMLEHFLEHDQPNPHSDRAPHGSRSSPS